MKYLNYFYNQTYIYISIVVLFLVTMFTYYVPIEIDLTRNHYNSISKESKIALKNMPDKEMEVYYFSAITNPAIDTTTLERIKIIFNQFKKYNKNIKYKIVTLNNDSELNEEFTDVEKKSIVIKVGDRTIMIPFESFAISEENKKIITVEKVLINELNKAVNDTNYDVHYYISDNNDINETEYSDFEYLMEKKGYTLSKVDIEKDSLENVRMLYIISPYEDISEETIQKLKLYVDDGNNLFITLDSGITNSRNFTNIKKFCSDIGVDISDEIIIDKIEDKKLIGAYTELEENIQVKKLNPIVYMPNSRKMFINNRSDFIIDAVMFSGDLISDVENIYSTFPLILKLEGKNTKIIISASSEFMNNNNILNNKYFVSYMADTMDKYEEDINIDDFVFMEYTTNPNDLKPSLVFGFIEVIIPCIIVYAGLEICKGRKNDKHEEYNRRGRKSNVNNRKGNKRIKEKIK